MMTPEPGSASDGARPHPTKTPSFHLVTLAVPSEAERRAAWDALPPEVQARIGTLAVAVVLNAFVEAGAYAPEGAALVVSPEADAAQSERSAEDIEALHEVVEAALPAIFGPPAGYPAWSIQH